MTMIVERTKCGAPHRAAITRVAVLLLIALLALLLTGCRASFTETDPLPSPAPSNQYTPLDDSSVYVDEPDGYTDEPGGYTDDPGDYTDDSGGGTDPCAFPGDPLCPDTPITVPPPNLDPW